MDEHVEHRSEDSQVEDDQQRDERFERVLTQRELVRASLLRCPPEDPSEPRRQLAASRSASSTAHATRSAS